MRYLLILALLISGCSKSEAPDVPGESLNDIASIEVTVLYCDTENNPSCDPAGFLPGAFALVKLYNEIEDREDGVNEAHSGHTSGAGKVLFTGLTNRQYYLSTTFENETIESFERTPANSISHHEIVFVR